jgi:hypothetical protein
VSKRTITLLSLAAIILNVIAFVGFGSPFATYLKSCTSPTHCTNALSSAVVIGFVLYLGGVLAAIVAWLMGLVKTAQIRRWGWFLTVLLLSPLGSLLYGLAGPATKAKQ